MVEIEAKFLINKKTQIGDALQTIRKLGYVATEGPNETLCDRYFDTSDLAILRAGWNFRSRQRRSEAKLTLKASGTRVGPVFIRDRIDQLLSGPTDGCGDLPAGAVQAELARISNGASRRELFRVRVDRRVFRIIAADGGDETIVELALDRTQITPGDSTPSAAGKLELTELELELKEGAPKELHDLATTLRDEAGLLPARLTKFERGLQTSGLAGADKPCMPADSSRAHEPLLLLAYDYLGSLLLALKEHQPVAWEGVDPEGVHQMRVAIRRTRSLLRAFREMFPADVIAPLNSELRWLANTLGSVRDADVYGEAFRDYKDLLSLKDSGALEGYEQYLDEAAEEARRRLIDALASDRYEALIAMWEQFIETGPSIAYLRRFGGVSVAEGAELHINRMLKKILRRGRRIGKDSPPESLHRLRIDGKRLRYLLEFFGNANPEQWRPLTKATKQLQNLLGEYQDACVARDRVAEYAHAAPTPKKNARDAFIALGRLMQREEERMTRSRSEFANAWKRFEKRCA